MSGDKPSHDRTGVHRYLYEVDSAGRTLARRSLDEQANAVADRNGVRTCFGTRTTTPEMSSARSGTDSMTDQYAGRGKCCRDIDHSR